MYRVVLLIEQPLSPADVEQVVGLHDDPVSFHVLLPVDPLETFHAVLSEMPLGDGLGMGRPMPVPVVAEDSERAEERARPELEASIELIRATGHEATGELTLHDPIGALTETVERLGADEVIVLTRPHLVAETLHTDWTHRARRRVGVPVLHLLAHSAPDG